MSCEDLEVFNCKKCGASENFPTMLVRQNNNLHQSNSRLKSEVSRLSSRCARAIKERWKEYEKTIDNQHHLIKELMEENYQLKQELNNVRE